MLPAATSSHSTNSGGLGNSSAFSPHPNTNSSAGPVVISERRAESYFPLDVYDLIFTNFLPPSSPFRHRHDAAPLSVIYQPTPVTFANLSLTSKALLAISAGRDALHALPAELLDMIVDRVIPNSPYLARPYGERVGHFAVAPAMRVLDSWGTTCIAACRLISAVRKSPNWSIFSTLASRVKYEALGTTPAARAVVIEQYGSDPERFSTPHALLLELQSSRALTRCANSLQGHANNLEKLDLRLCSGTYSDLAILASALRQCTGLKVLSMDSNVPFAQSLLAAMDSLPALRTLVLRGPALPADLFAHLSNLPAGEKLECLSVSAPDLSGSQLQTLALNANRLVALRFLTLNGDSLDEDACAAIATACKNLKHLESLEIGALVGTVSTGGASALLEDLATNTHVTRLGLDQSAKKEGGSAALFDSIRQFRTLNELRLSDSLQPSAVEQIARMLGDPELHLQALDLECAELDENCMVALADAVKTSPWLNELRLAYANFTEAGATTLARAITSNCRLLKLTLHECDIDPDVLQRTLIGALSCSVTLRELHVQIPAPKDESNDNTQRLASLFSYAADKNSSLLHMTIWGFIDGMNNVLHNQSDRKLAQNRRRTDPG